MTWQRGGRIVADKVEPTGAAATTGNQQGIEGVYQLEKFESRCPLTGNDLRMVKWWNQYETALIN